MYYFKVKAKDDIGTGLLKVRMADALNISEKDMVIKSINIKPPKRVYLRLKRDFLLQLIGERRYFYL